MFPPYRSGYRLQVGSDYFITAPGRLLNADDEPLSLVAGQVTELAEPERDKSTVFTNSADRVALSGLRAGRWRIDMLSEPPLTYFLEISGDAAEIIRAGDLRPASQFRTLRTYTTRGDDPMSCWRSSGDACQRQQMSGKQIFSAPGNQNFE